jgi:hypothetical protein
LIAVGDLNADDRDDVVAAPNDGVGTPVAVYLGDGLGGFAEPDIPIVGAQASGLALGDLDGDDNLDIVVAWGSTLTILLGTGDGSFQPPIDLALLGLATSLALADVDADGVLDALVGGLGLTVLLGDGTGGFNLNGIYYTDEFLTDLSVHDLNGDGALDVAAGSNEYIAIFLGVGDGTGYLNPQYGAFVEVQGEPVRIAVADLDGDGRVDLAAALPNNSMIALFAGNGDGTFGPLVGFAAGGRLEGIAIADLDNDSRPDILVPVRDIQIVSAVAVMRNLSDVETPDTAPPVIGPMPDINATATSAVGAVVTYAPAIVSDFVDPSPEVTYSRPSGGLFRLGRSTVDVTATDDAGNVATDQFYVYVTYAWTGFLQPLDYTQLAIYARGSTIPVRFRLRGASADVTNAVARFRLVAQASAKDPGAINRVGVTNPPTSGDLFRYIPEKGYYIFYWSTTGLARGTYRIRVELGDGTWNVIRVGLK